MANELFCPIFERHLRNTSKFHVSTAPTSDFEVKLCICNSGIILVKFIELSFFKENNSIPHLTFDFPVLLLKSSKLCPGGGWDIQSSGIIVRIVRGAFFGIFDVY